MKNLFICHTPLHLLFALSIGESLRDVSILLYDDDIKNNSIVSAIKLNYSNINILEINTHRNPIKFFYTKKKLKKIIKNITSLYIFHDAKPETCFCINYAKINKKEVNLVEDGVAIYDVGGKLDFSIKSIIFGKFLYGSWWRPKNKIGAYTVYNNLYATNSAEVRDEVKYLNSIKLEFSSIDRLKVNLGGADCVFVVPLTSGQNLSDIIMICNNIIKCNNKVALKFHPREDAISLKIFLDEIVGAYLLLDAKIPLELYLIAPETPVKLIGYRTSSLYLGKIIDDSVESYFIEFNEENHDIWRNFYHKMNVSEYLYEQ